MRGRFRRRASPIADLDVTAFINLMVVLVAFFLSSVTYFQFSSQELNIPPASSAAANAKATLELEVIIRKDGLEVNNRNGGLLRRLAKQAGAYDYSALNAFQNELQASYHAKLVAAIWSTRLSISSLLATFSPCGCFSWLLTPAICINCPTPIP